jgi:hypothetical protein
MRSKLGPLQKRLESRGFDLFHVFDLKTYNQSVSRELQLSPFENVENTLGILVGNSKMLWPKFVQFRQENEGWNSRKNPFDDFVEREILDTVSDTFDSALFATHFAHEVAPGRLIAMQKLGHVTNFAFLHRKSHLSLHPIYGPWFAYRAVVFVEKEASDGNLIEMEQKEPKNPLSPKRKALVEEAFVNALKSCEDWRLWLKCRDIIGEGFEEWRYSDDQIRFHYKADAKCGSK